MEKVQFIAGFIVVMVILIVLSVPNEVWHIIDVIGGLK